MNESDDRPETASTLDRRDVLRSAAALMAGTKA
jgi:hypothetical protein